MTEEELGAMSDEEFAEYENSPEAAIPDEVLDELDTESEAPEEVVEDPTEDEVEKDDIILDEEDTKPTEEVELESDTADDNPETLEDDIGTEEENTQQSDEVVNEFKTQYEMVMAPIRANRQDITIKSPEDARILIQKGLNYDDKMAAIKPVRLAGKALERAGIIRDGVIDEGALNRMIDFNNGDIEVMKARLKELEIDPLDLDLDDTNYQASDNIPDEHSVALDDIQRELDNRGSTEQVVNVLQGFDEGSKNYFTENPRDLLGLEQDITSGVFDEIYGNVKYERSMGRLDNKTDMEAYIEFAKARGETMEQMEATPEEPKAKPTKVVDTKKRARAGGTAAANSKGTEVVNPWELSDEEFEAQFGGQQALR